jgi:hypothetical protein
MVCVILSSLNCAYLARDASRSCRKAVQTCKRAKHIPFVHVVGARCRPGRIAGGLPAVHRLCRVLRLHDWLLRCVPSNVVWGFCRCAVWAVCLVRGCLLPLVLPLLLRLCC